MIEDIKWEIEHYYKKYIKYPYYDLIYGIINLFKWFKVIWNLRSWDWTSILEVLHKQILETEKSITKYHNHVYWERDVKNLKKTRICIERILKDNYYENALIGHDIKWGKNIMFTVPVYHGNEKMYEMKNYFNKNITDKKWQEYAKKSYSRKLKHAGLMKKQDLEYACKMINKHLFEWWD